MNLLTAIREAVGTLESTQVTCFTCVHFCNDLSVVEAALPGIGSFSSIHASVRADDGLCERHQTLINGKRRCADYVPRA